MSIFGGAVMAALVAILGTMCCLKYAGYRVPDVGPHIYYLLAIMVLASIMFVFGGEQ